MFFLRRQHVVTFTPVLFTGTVHIHQKTHIEIDLFDFLVPQYLLPIIHAETN